MYVCLCHAITDRQIKEIVAAGATSFSELQAQLGVGNCCGCCTDLASSFLSTNTSNQNQVSVTAGIKVQN